MTPDRIEEVRDSLGQEARTVPNRALFHYLQAEKVRPLSSDTPISSCALFDKNERRDNAMRRCRLLCDTAVGAVLQSIADRAVGIVFTCVVAPNAVRDIARLVPLAKIRVPAWQGNARSVGAALYRAGRQEDVSRRQALCSLTPR
jgi:hypothetical protein